MFKTKHIYSIAYYTLFSLMFSVLLPVFNAFAKPIDYAEYDAMQSESIIFCTSQGIKVIDLESFLNGSYLSKLNSYPSLDSLDELPENMSYNLDVKCGMCLVSNAVYLPVPFAVQFPFLMSLIKKESYTIQPSLVKESTLVLRGSYGRAPPFFL